MSHKILLVDDEPHALRILQLGLKKVGFEIDTAPNGLVAFEKITAEHPDALVTDIDMPKMTGTELCAKIRDEIPDRDFMIILLTSRAELEHREWSREMPNLEFMEKPVSVRRLVARLQEYFESD